jgi:hypothetical protein
MSRSSRRSSTLLSPVSEGLRCCQVGPPVGAREAANLLSTPLENWFRPELWDYVGETARNGIGLKLARFRANADHTQAKSARELLDLVDGTAYVPESDREVELAEALDELILAHVGFNNFYSEPPVARWLRDLVGRYGKVPAQLRSRYVHEIVYVFLTNGHGVAWNADPIYQELIELFDGEQAALALRSFADTKDL